MPPRSNSLRSKLPTKWLLAIIGLLLIYGLAQPTLNSRFGWSLPSVASLLKQDAASPSKAGQDPSKPSADTTSASNAKKPPQSTSTNKQQRESEQRQSPPRGQSLDAELGHDDSIAEDMTGKATESVENFLHESAPGSEDFLSPAGLRYTRGSEEGHRLKHLAKHLEDQPNRPGKHGVFEGDLLQVLRWLDDAFERAKRGAKGTSQSAEDRRTIYEVNFDQAIGYIGGRDGKRSGNPSAKRVRLVVEGNRVITAFPF